ncbi:MAG: sulfotransferase [Phycisphaerales bacterium]
MSDAPARPPIFILGVPRSGTTLLRTILDSHSAIACGPETPWLAPHQPRSLGELWRFLREDPHGYCASFGMEPAAANRAARAFADSLLGDYARARGKARWAEKTPDNIRHLDFLLGVFPDARWVYLVRDGLDVALSTSTIPPHRAGISEWLEKNLSLGWNIATANTPFSALLRWRHWSRMAERSLRGVEHLRVGYERLVSEPEDTLRLVMDFVGEPFEPEMLRYAERPHDYPPWEWGSADVRERRGITKDRVGRARAELTGPELEALRTLLPPEPGSAPGPCAALASTRDIHDPPFGVLMAWLNAFAGPLNLQTFASWSKIWELPWLWFRALSGTDLAGRHLVDIGGSLLPLPWIAALLGARVTLVESDPQHIPLWTRLRDRMGLDVQWHITADEHTPLADGEADIVLSVCTIARQNKPAAIAETARVLKAGGLFALSFDLCEPEMGMTFPRWNGQALTMAEFETLIWRHPAFGNTAPPAWNTADIAPFLDWHRGTAKHHNYIVGAAVLRKQ